MFSFPELLLARPVGAVEAYKTGEHRRLTSGGSNPVCAPGLEAKSTVGRTGLTGRNPKRTDLFSHLRNKNCGDNVDGCPLHIPRCDSFCIRFPSQGIRSTFLKGVDSFALGGGNSTPGETEAYHVM